MPFIGKQPQTGAYSKLDAITTSATATYNLTLDSSAYYPQSANHLLVSLNGVMQAPQDSFTVSGSQITFASALTSSDNIDFIMALGDTLDIGVPSAGSVNTSQLANDAVTTAKLDSTLDLSGKTVTYGLTDSDMPAGSVLQVVSTVKSTSFSTTNNTDDDITGFSATLTPSSSSSKILVLVSAQVRALKTSGSGNNFVNFGVKRSSPSATTLLDGYAISGDNGDSLDHRDSVAFNYLDSPATTSAVTYQCTLRAQFTATAYVNSTTSPSTITLMEIAG